MADLPQKDLRHVPATGGSDTVNVTEQDPRETRPHTAATNPTGWPVLSLFSGAGGLDLGFHESRIPSNDSH